MVIVIGMSGKSRDSYEILKLLSDPQRVEILRRLRKEEVLSYSDLWRLTHLQSGRLGFQMRKLKPLLRKTQEDLYALNETGLKALDVLDYYEKILSIEKPGNFRTRDCREITVREAVPEDYPFIVEANCSWVDKWLKPVGEKWVEVSYDELTPWERVIGRGYWTDLSVYRAWATGFLKNGDSMWQ